MNVKRKIPFALFQAVSAAKNRLLLSKAYPLAANELSCQPFFIVGSGRSGNTLLRRLLVASGEVCIPPESYVLARAARKFLYFNHWPWPKLAETIVREFAAHPEFVHWQMSLETAVLLAKSLPANKRSFADLVDVVYCNYSQEHAAKVMRWGDKTPTNALFFDHIAASFPNAQYIHLLRDPRAVFYSYKTSGLLPATRWSEKKNIAQLWLDSHNKLMKVKQSSPWLRFTEIHYEDLVSQPQMALNRLCAYLQIGYSDQLLSFWQEKTDGDVSALDHHKNARKPISSSGIERWRQHLSPEELELIEAACMPLYNQLLQTYPLNFYK